MSLSGVIYLLFMLLLLLVDNSPAGEVGEPFANPAGETGSLIQTELQAVEPVSSGSASFP